MSLNKIASTAALRAFRKGLLSESGLKKVVEYTGKTTKLKHLGEGGSQWSDLAMDPEFGKSVMKMLKTNVIQSSGRKRINFLDLNPSKSTIELRNKEYNAWQYLNKLMKGKDDIQIAPLVGRRGTTHFQKYVKDDGLQASLKKRFDAADKERDLANIFPSRDEPKEVWEAARERLRKADEEYLNALDAYQKKMTFNEPTTKVLNKFKKKYPKAWDMVIRNQASGKLVDFEPGEKRDIFKEIWANKAIRNSLIAGGSVLPAAVGIGVSAHLDGKKRKEESKRKIQIRKNDERIS